MLSPRRFILTTLMAAPLVAALLMGCAGLPAQEMSNARQAVRAAQLAGAAQYSPEALAEAERLLQSAKANQSKGEYRAARDDAELAREKAMEARRLAEAAKAGTKEP